MGFLLSVPHHSGPRSGLGSTKGWVPCLVFFSFVKLLVYSSFLSICGKITVRSSCVLWPLPAQNLQNILQCVVQHREPCLSSASWYRQIWCPLARSWGSLATCDVMTQNISGLVLSTATLSSGNISWQISIIATTWIC